jgi:hypothetical protein
MLVTTNGNDERWQQGGCRKVLHSSQQIEEEHVEDQQVLITRPSRGSWGARRCLHPVPASESSGTSCVCICRTTTVMSKPGCQQFRSNTTHEPHGEGKGEESMCRLTSCLPFRPHPLQWCPGQHSCTWPSCRRADASTAEAAAAATAGDMQ